MNLTYAYYDNRYPNTYSRRCIDGSIAGCSKCVGYCQYEGHEGFLTEKHRKDHDCLRKECYYYLPKLKADHKQKEDCLFAAKHSNYIMAFLAKYEGLRPMYIEQDGSGTCLIKYITISNAYPIKVLEQELSKALGQAVKMVKLNYDFDNVVQLLFA